MPKKLRPVELNIDLGELPEEPPELYRLATTVNLACGGHAGDERSMRAAVELAIRYGAAIAAHPSYPDREGFGRRPRFSDVPSVRAAVEHQCTGLHEIAADLGATVHAMKPHGALYHDASNDADLAGALIEGAKRALPDLSRIVGPPDTAFEDIVVARGLVYVREGFADRRYDGQFKLLPRTRKDALILDAHECVSQALFLARMAKVDTLCVHGDTPDAVTIAYAVRSALEREGLLAAPGARGR